MDLPQKIEALLFFKAEPVSVSWLARALAVSEGEVWEGLAELEKLLAGRGICVIQKDDTAVLGTAPGASELVEKTLKEDLERTLGAAALEALAIIAYKGPIAKSEIDYIRGVNSSCSLRNLLIRGLIERTPSQDDKRVFLYTPSIELFAYLGITKESELPEYETVKQEIAQFEKEFTAAGP